jgi:hypothetical protein
VNLAGFWRALALLERDDDPDDDRTILARAKAYVDNRGYHAELVADLPARGDGGHLYAIQSDPTGLYMGRGPNLPLLRFGGTPVA